MITEGEKILLIATFTDYDGNLIDPPGVLFTILPPDGSNGLIDVPTVNTSLGVYEIEYSTTVKGIYYYKFETTDGSIKQGHFSAQRDNTE